MYDIVIIGSGPAGLSASVYAKRDPVPAGRRIVAASLSETESCIAYLIRL